jgi:non-canonical purine NTP pyrophosphatase (RdgB/HAM1 family)
MDFVFATGSDAKHREAEEILGGPLSRVMLDLPEIQAATAEEVALEKARAAFRKLHRAVVVEDSGLEFSAWRGMPGPFTKWFEKALGLEGLCRALDGSPDRGAEAACVLAFKSGSDEFLCSGRLTGRIAPSPRGLLGFGWDAIFVPAGESRTLAEFPAREKNEISHRCRAWREFHQRREGPPTESRHREAVQYDGRVFRLVFNSEGGEAGAATLFHYHQDGDVVWATYQGGGIQFGTLTARADASGCLDIRYHHVNTEGEIRAGRCFTVPEVLSDGRLRLHERWQWSSGDESTGESIAEEI